MTNRELRKDTKVSPFLPTNAKPQPGQIKARSMAFERMFWLPFSDILELEYSSLLGHQLNRF